MTTFSRGDLAGHLREAGMPRDEVEKLLKALEEFWRKGGSIDDLTQDKAVLEKFGLQPGTMLVLKAILDTLKSTPRTQNDDDDREDDDDDDLRGLRVDLRNGASDDDDDEDDYDDDEYDDYDDDEFEQELAEEDVNLATVGDRRWTTPAGAGKKKKKSTTTTTQKKVNTPQEEPPPRRTTTTTPTTAQRRGPAEKEKRIQPPHEEQEQEHQQPHHHEERRAVEKVSASPQAKFFDHPVVVPGGGGERFSLEENRLLRSVTTRNVRQSPTAKHILKGQWKLGQCIGQGSFGAVYTCMDEATGQLMAVKIMAIPTSSKAKGAVPTELKNLCNEIELMQSFKHENIVRYLGATFDTQSLQLYIFQDWVPGGSLAELSKSYGALAESVVRRYTVHVLKGLAYLHANHIIHRDVKCGNVLVDETGVAKLADFGASHRLGTDGTLTADMNIQTMRGTPFFMAPEVLKQEKFGRRSDVWSVGGVVLQMATTDPPWKLNKFRTPMALFYHVVSTNERPPLEPYNLSPSLRRFILRCFERNPLKRPHATELLDDDFLTQIEDDDDDDDVVDSGTTRREITRHHRKPRPPQAHHAAAKMANNNR
eukprot:CAMPEP_0118896722 /NCGR_PEP_ID=MMETSP1166-20130328/4449_1 /TAXON_ID=1104430 /ORGANISM="Chrysoreinhardia sp, Strain CCMP3193" /LENGTH=593 /DNA_ID=CAMNT_0006835781 /DNA_START=39 /DNA_END=1820 /DNA_ORIENTATION=-